MMDNALWFDKFYLENFALITGFLVLLGIPLFILKDKKIKTQASWASVKSWLYALPFLFFFIGLPDPGPFVFLCLVAIYSSKRFFQMVGIYHRHIFVFATYIGFICCGFALLYEKDFLFFLAPSIMLFVYCLVPIILNNPKNMIQYISLTFVCFFLFGWNLIIAGKLFDLPMGVYLLIYLYVLSEFAANATNGLSLMLPSSPVVGKITTKSKWSGFTLSFILTLFLAWAFRRLLFDDSEFFWVSAGLICFFSAHLGEWTISTFRRDLNVKDHGVFIIGRGDLLSRTNKVMFTYPLYTLLMWCTKNISFTF